MKSVFLGTITLHQFERERGKKEGENVRDYESILRLAFNLNLIAHTTYHGEWSAYEN